MTGTDKKTSGKTFREPAREFESTGFVVPEDSYFVPIDNVTNKKGQNIRTMVDRGKYFSIFAPRQSGKTTFFEETVRQLHKDPTYVGITLTFQNYHNLDTARFYSQIEKKLYKQLISRLKQVNCEKLEVIQTFLESHRLSDHISFQSLFEKLNALIRYKKIVIFIDEFDGIPLGELEDFLNTLRGLYQEYKSFKPKALYSVGLIGIRNVTKLVVGGVSPFNIADQVSLPPFSLDNVRNLYAQYTAETNQPFTDAALRKIYEETAGQTWLVNRLGTILTVDIKPRTVEPVDENDVQQAVGILLNEDNDHFDNLYEKAKLYKETFVEIVFDCMEYNIGDEDQGWLKQYGLIKNNNGTAETANNIYKTRFLKMFFKEAKADRHFSLKPYLLPGNRLDIKQILFNFGAYISQIGVKAFYAEAKPYEKTGQFLLTAWLYQFVRGGKDKSGGEVRDELLTGLGRLDIMLSYKGKKYIFELKVNRHDDINIIIDQGIYQLSAMYLATEEESEGTVVVFDTRTPVGASMQSQLHTKAGKEIMSIIIPIGNH